MMQLICIYYIISHKILPLSCTISYTWSDITFTEKNGAKKAPLRNFLGNRSFGKWSHFSWTLQSQLSESIIAKYQSIHIFTHSCPHWWFFGQNLILRKNQRGTAKTATAEPWKGSIRCGHENGSTKESFQILTFFSVLNPWNVIQ